MINGIKLWNDKSIRYDQTRNSTEAIIEKVLKAHHVNKSNLESCGASSFATLMEGMGLIKANEYPAFGKMKIQFDDFLMSFVNDPANNYQSGYSFDNRAMETWWKVAKEYFGVSRAIYKGSWSFNEIAGYINQGAGAHLCLINPGHYIAGIAYDNDKKEIIYSDSYGTRKGLKNKGWQERLTKGEFNTNCMKYAVIYVP